MPLPTQPTPPRFNLEEIRILLYGVSKVGRSTFASQFPNALFLASDPGLSALNVYQQPIRSWLEFLTACGEIVNGNHQFKTIVLDKVDILYNQCCEHFYNKFEIVHESDLGFGKGWAIIRNEFYRALLKLCHMPYGLILISDAQEEEVKTRTGTITRMAPGLQKAVRQMVVGLMDLILYCDLEPDGSGGYRRVIRPKLSPEQVGGDRFVLPGMIDLSYKALVEAFKSGADTKMEPAKVDTTKNDTTKARNT